MKILCISYEYPPLGGGGAPVCEGICRALVDAGHSVDVVTSRMKGLAEEERRGGVLVHRHSCVRTKEHYTTIPELATGLWPAAKMGLRLVRAGEYDLIHCHFIVPSGIVARWVGRRTGLPYVLTAHGSDVPGYNPDRFHLAHRLIGPVWRNVLRNAAAVTTPSRFLSRSIRSRVDIPVEVIPNGYDPPRRPEAARRNRVLVVTRMFERKGVQHLIRAMRGIDPAWSLHIVGDGPYLPVLREEAARAGVEAVFHGYVRGEPLADLYHSAKIFSLPSSHENFPVVLLEAMGAGCAIVTTSGTGCEEVVGSAGVCVEPGDSQALHDVLARLTSDDEEIQRLRARALARSERFTWRSIGREFEALFRRHARVEGHTPARP